MRSVRAITGLTIYLIACSVALFILFASTERWFGFEDDPASAIFAFVLGLPWTAIGGALIDSPGGTAGVAILIVGMGINIALIVVASRFLARRRQSG